MKLVAAILLALNLYTLDAASDAAGIVFGLLGAAMALHLIFKD